MPEGIEKEMKFLFLYSQYTTKDHTHQLLIKQILLSLHQFTQRILKLTNIHNYCGQNVTFKDIANYGHAFQMKLHVHVQVLTEVEYT